ncbi:hypothetical protein FZEAL_7786 [Fusarium zealandicum]|uniref:EGF-like domain-containing protein n=1 Tax=Fusarium zealandicum TaxID=1053134 RepID=A0A8H4UFV9_9HYPO|nr:hypothetical protein FZEAL_7786 [Fusarium zealandicum]
MDAPLSGSGSVKRARERAQAGIPLHQPLPLRSETMDDGPPGDLRAPPRRPMAAQPPGQSRLPRPKPGPAMDIRNGNAGPAISRPTQVPQWPLPGPPMAAMNQPEPEPYRPPPGRPLQAPQRPPRPSQVPSMLDQSRLQDPTPVFLTPESDDYYSSVPPSPSSRMTTSSLGSVPDFPTPNASLVGVPQRRSTYLGPPPSSRRGASSFYSNASYVSPIPEESLKSKSHGSYASSAAMPDTWPSASRQVSPTFYDETDTEKSHDSGDDEFNDESKLVRSASIGRKGKPSLVNTKSVNLEAGHRPAPSPVQPFESGTAYMDVSTNSSNTLPMAKPQAHNPKDGLSPDAILGAYAAASATNMAESPAPSPSPQPFSRLSAIRRPPMLDIDAVRKAEERGSITSLPDLIRRATQLASMMDRGRRPTSRFGDLSDYLDEKGQYRGGDKENSGLSDMLAAFPPPAHAQTDRQSRGSWFRTTSWPLAPSRQGEAPSRSGLRDMTSSDSTHSPEGKRRRRCCGLPVWGFVLVLIFLLGIIAAAVLVPLEFFVFKNLSNNDKPKTDLAQCQESLQCHNGGTNTFAEGICSCICTNGFTGSDCSANGSDGCTTADFGGDLSNVTLGKAIPQLIENSEASFSIPLSGTDILAKLTSGNLSCIAQNSLVTFDGHSIRKAEASSNSADKKREVGMANLPARAASAAVSISPDDAPSTFVMDEGAPAAVPTTADPAQTSAAEASLTDSSAVPTATFSVTEEVVDFARVAVLYVLQEQDLDSAKDAQDVLGRFLTKAGKDSGVTTKVAESIKIGEDSTVDMRRYKIDLGSGAVGGNTKRDRLAAPARRQVGQKADYLARRGGSLRARR